jgi:tRNA G18 (ribose-2'-O)-methylase SpoU
MRQKGVLVVGLERCSASVPLSEAIAQEKLSAPLCLVLGNEVMGVSAEALSFCDLVCHLPMRGKKQSLNVAVAFGIAAYQIAEALAPPGR